MARRILFMGALLVALVGLASPVHAQDDSYTPPSSIDSDVEGTGAERGTGTGVGGTSTGSGTLPVTGSDSTENLVRVGIVLLAAGGLLVFAVRRRTAPAVTH
jgi:LPXTG-motif cell wall-anchored protein